MRYLPKLKISAGLFTPAISNAYFWLQIAHATPDFVQYDTAPILQTETQLVIMRQFLLSPLILGVPAQDLGFGGGDGGQQAAAFEGPTRECFYNFALNGLPEGSFTARRFSLVRFHI